MLIQSKNEDQTAVPRCADAGRVRQFDDAGRENPDAGRNTPGDIGGHAPPPFGVRSPSDCHGKPTRAGAFYCCLHGDIRGDRQTEPSGVCGYRPENFRDTTGSASRRTWGIRRYIEGPQARQVAHLSGPLLFRRGGFICHSRRGSAQISPINFWPQIFATNRATGQTLDGRAVFGWHRALMLPLPNGGLGDAKRPGQRNARPDTLGGFRDHVFVHVRKYRNT